jgi:hypothetical protein
MGTLQSPIPGLDRVVLNPWPARVTKGTTVVRCGRAVVGVTAQKTVFSNVCDKKRNYPFTCFNGMEDLMRCLLLLGVIDQAGYDLHVTRVKAEHATSDKGWAAYHVLEAHGNKAVTLTTSQIKQCWKAMRDVSQHFVNERTDRLAKLGLKPIYPVSKLAKAWYKVEEGLKK